MRLQKTIISANVFKDMKNFGLCAPFPYFSIHGASFVAPLDESILSSLLLSGIPSITQLILADDAQSLESA